jgi:hypothetical protein
MNNQEILDSNPVGFYTNVSMSNGKPFVWACNNFRSLADIKRIVELEKENTKLKKIVDNHSGGFVACMTGNQFTANNLKQQAKALNEYAYSNKPLTKRGLNLKSIALIDQAKALKEPKT